ncbi:MAG: DUF2142 domain-containing protein [Oscillospiraceae bacterium]|nr:DUF2142 domain-containing protein [Oscillospiraceae bacterium]
MAEKVQNLLNSLKQKPMLPVGIGCLLLFCIDFFIVYFTRVVYSPVWLGQINGTIVLFAITFAIAVLAFIAKKLAKQNTPLFMAMLIFVAGAVFAFVTPPNQVPDEPSHFLRSYAMGMGDFHFDEEQEWPNDVNLLIDHFPIAYRNGYPAEKGNSILTQFGNYSDAIEKGETGTGVGIIIFQIVPYLPSAFGIFVGRLFGAGALVCYWLARLANLAFYSVCCYFALSWAKRFNVIMFSLMALPLTLFIAASCNNDSVLFGLMFLLFGAVLSDSFDRKKAITFAVGFAVLCTSKISYIVFAPLFFAISKDKWNIKAKKWQYGLCVLAAFVVVYLGTSMSVSLLSNYGEIPRTMSDSNPAEQLKFILSNPLRYFVVFLDTLRNNSFFLSSGGLFGWIDVDIKIVSFATPVVLMLNTFKNAHRLDKRDVPMTAMFFATALLTYGVVLTGMYMSWTPVTLPQVIGLQMRYLFPAFMGILLVVAQWANLYTKQPAKQDAGQMSAVWTSFVFALVSSMLLFAAYYLPTKVIVYVS